MSWLASLALAVFHVVYWLVSAAKRLLTIAQQPQPLLAIQRRKLPAHLALVLVADPRYDKDAAEDTMVDSVERAVMWCRAVGINRLTVYDREGLLSTLSLDIQRRLLKGSTTPLFDSDLETEIEYPLTPPSSDDSDSRPLSPDSEITPLKLNVASIQLPEHAAGKSRRRPLGVKLTTRRRRATDSPSASAPFTLHILSRKSGKPSIAEVATALLRRRSVGRSKFGDRSPAPLEAELSSMLEGNVGFPEPDLMLIHHIHPCLTSDLMELHGFPPWQIRLTEFDQYEPTDRWWHLERSAGRPLDEVEFRRALDTYAAAEMRLGK